MSTLLRSILLSVLVSLLPGCGYIYTNTTNPYCTDMDNTPVGNSSGKGTQRNLAIPRVVGANVSWSSNAIAQAAERAGLKRVYYCDLKRFSVLGSLWREETIIVYGE